VISQDDVARIRDEIGRLALQAVRIDLDGFLEATDAVGSPQALAAGIDPHAVASASEWSEIARLLKPFRDEAVVRIDRIRAELAEENEDIVEVSMACPQCHERRVDELTLKDDGSVVCANCGHSYSVAEEEAGDAC
jgi:formylmethanofuran dehydrogenase subunit E